MATPPRFGQVPIPIVLGAANLLHYFCPGTLGLLGSAGMEPVRRGPRTVPGAAQNKETHDPDPLGRALSAQTGVDLDQFGVAVAIGRAGPTLVNWRGH